MAITNDMKVYSLVTVLLCVFLLSLYIVITCISKRRKTAKPQRKTKASDKTNEFHLDSVDEASVVSRRFAIQARDSVDRTNKSRMDFVDETLVVNQWSPKPSHSIRGVSESDDGYLNCGSGFPPRRPKRKRNRLYKNIAGETVSCIIDDSDYENQGSDDVYLGYRFPSRKPKRKSNTVYGKIEGETVPCIIDDPVRFPVPPPPDPPNPPTHRLEL